eukprot:gnl/TRDRNA2_/TRDRNA2_66855_c0_seq1.p1 gnl/TRDRNA2_/TRDRNA2_66855_c0~~gnl/TRDRNA2_/TRDRNA2_66855_c0_seq1.p1  ORF type:complete len:141 (-),score=14.04 gnl/TRDRNA2_/TRDRNA2_66855_c0_seq1:30-452(-)
MYGFPGEIPSWLSILLFINAGIDLLIYLSGGQIAIIDYYKIIEDKERVGRQPGKATQYMCETYAVHCMFFLLHGSIRLLAAVNPTAPVCMLCIFSYIFEMIHATRNIFKEYMYFKDAIGAYVICGGMSASLAWYGLQLGK